MRKNVGTIDATIRITMGLLGLAYGIGKMSSRNARTPWLLMGLSAMKVAEGVTRYCPMLDMMGTNTRNDGDSKQISAEKGTKQGTSFTETMIANAVENMIGAEIAKNPEQGKSSAPAQNSQPAKSNQSLSASDKELEKQLKDFITGQGVTTASSTESRRPSDAYQADERNLPHYS